MCREYERIVVGVWRERGGSVNVAEAARLAGLIWPVKAFVLVGRVDRSVILLQDSCIHASSVPRTARRHGHRDVLAPRTDQKRYSRLLHRLSRTLAFTGRGAGSPSQGS